MNMFTPINTVFPRLTPVQKKALQRLGLHTIRDLLYWMPTRYSDISHITAIPDMKADESVTVYGKLSHIQTKKSFRGNIPMATATLTDITGETLRISWFHQPFIAKQFHDGDTVKLTGKVSAHKTHGLTLNNPEIERAPDLPIDKHESLFTVNGKAQFGYAIYRESRGITSKWLYHAIKKILTQDFIETLEDPLPEKIRKKYHLPDLTTALIWIHQPQKKEHAESAKKRFAFEEIFVIQVIRQKIRREYESYGSYALTLAPDQTTEFISRFPFAPTSAQKNAINTALQDMSQNRPMSRLIEGDVGSGKTFVAAVLTHIVTQNKPFTSGGKPQEFGSLQTAYMAPTEVLATQLFENFIQYFKNTGIAIGLMTGSGCRKFPTKVSSNAEPWTNISRTQLLKWIKNGEIPIVIGTHALLSPKVIFKDLGLVIIDEQHRFGTRQRKHLARKDGRVPHFLSMTATPIPRTLAMTLYGDLDISIIDTMPKGRKKVITQIIAVAEQKNMYENIRNELIKGRQVYIICPRIDEPDLSDDQKKSLLVKSVTSEARNLQKNIFPEYCIGVMHSKMTKSKKEEVMKLFAEHAIDILVSTSVIEVGVNVPNASVMVIEGAERFGLAQLHQLRGRIMRGSYQPYCYLCISENSKLSDQTQERLRAVTSSHNGFELAEMDMNLRGIGDLAGIKQWGISDIGMEAIKNPKIVSFAREEAKNILESDPNLEKHSLLSYLYEHSQKHDIHFE